MLHKSQAGQYEQINYSEKTLSLDLVSVAERVIELIFLRHCQLCQNTVLYLAAGQRTI